MGWPVLALAVARAVGDDLAAGAALEALATGVGAAAAVCAGLCVGKRGHGVGM